MYDVNLDNIKVSKDLSLGYIYDYLEQEYNIAKIHKIQFRPVAESEGYVWLDVWYYNGKVVTNKGGDKDVNNVTSKDVSSETN